MDFNLKIWRQKDSTSKGKFVSYKVSNISSDSSFLEMLDVLNEELIHRNMDPVAFDHDCREGICGCCSLYINGRPHGPDELVTVCQLHMRKFKNGDTIVVEPWRARPFPVIKDLIVDRTAFDKIIIEGGYISVNTGNAPDSHAVLIPKENADLSMDAASCIGCGACIAACANASAMLFVGAKVSQLALLPQGKVEAAERVQQMVKEMDKLGFGNCSNTYACEAECPKLVNRSNIARMNWQFLKAKVCKEKHIANTGA
jgi:succinate dehydrogenase / fumarate reductase, iron-sulfur subunit